MHALTCVGARAFCKSLLLHGGNRRLRRINEVIFAARLLPWCKRQRATNLMANDPEVLTVKEVCDLLRIHRSTIYRLVRRGKIPSFKIGKDWRFRKDQIMRWIA